MLTVNMVITTAWLGLILIYQSKKALIGSTHLYRVGMVNLNRKQALSLSLSLNRKSFSSSLLLPNTTIESTLMVKQHLATGSAGLYGYGENVDDFEAMCNELYWTVEQRLIQHKLARDYYGFR